LKDGAPFEREDDEDVDQHLKRGPKLLNLNDPEAKRDWYELFSEVCDAEKHDCDLSVVIRDFALNLAASNNLLNSSRLKNLTKKAIFTLVASSLPGLLPPVAMDIFVCSTNRINAQTFDHMQEDEERCRVPTLEMQELCGERSIVAQHFSLGLSVSPCVLSVSQ
jgi:hypothetical protein